MSTIIVWLLIGLLAGYHIGWRIAHITVAAECERLGGFFVDRKTYKCVAIEPRKENP